MKRSELYARIWQTPMRILGPELGLSDVGLAKLCRRHRVPVPAVGYWAKLAAGKGVQRLPLPPLDADELVALPSQQDIVRRAVFGAQSKQRRAVEMHAQSSVVVGKISAVRPTLDGCNVLVSDAARFFERISPAQKEYERDSRSKLPDVRLAAWLRRPKNTCGRYTLFDQGQLHISASLKRVDWILRFHDALISGLVENGCRLRGGKRGIEVERTGEAVSFRFSEDYSRVQHQKGAAPWDFRTYVALNTYRLTMERAVGGAKQWRGDAAELEALLPAIVRGFIVTLDSQAGKRAAAQAEAEEKQRRAAEHAELQRLWLANQQLVGDRKAARRAQVGKATAAAMALDEFLAVGRLLVQVEARAPNDSAVGAWLRVVRSALSDPIDGLIEEIRRETGGEPPLWWPQTAAAKPLSE